MPEVRRPSERPRKFRGESAHPKPYSALMPSKYCRESEGRLHLVGAVKEPNQRKGGAAICTRYSMLSPGEAIAYPIFDRNLERQKWKNACGKVPVVGGGIDR